ncbi:MAG: hypothetical protein MJD61_13085, partial [Proteobacteria bacterium]|nr:hypothetical protein [Pseudomonadota bacterium]
MDARVVVAEEADPWPRSDHGLRKTLGLALVATPNRAVSPAPCELDAAGCIVKQEDVDTATSTHALDLVACEVS